MFIMMWSVSCNETVADTVVASYLFRIVSATAYTAAETRLLKQKRDTLV